MEQTNKKISSSMVILSFLVLEVLAFVGFSLGTSFPLYAIVGVATFCLILFLTNVQFKKEGLTSFAMFLIPLFVFGLVCVISGFSAYFDMTTNILVPVSFLAYAGIGYFANQFKDFKLKNAFLVIYSALALLTLISYCYNMIQFIPFYTLLYKNSYIVYDGLPSAVPIGRMAYMLVGFSFKEVLVEHFTIFPSLLVTSAVALFFINPKKDTKIFTLYAGFAVLGAIVLITMPTIMTVISSFVIACLSLFVVLYLKGKINRDIIKVGGIGIGALLVILFIVAFLNANGYLPFIASNPLLDKVFNSNRLATPFNFVLSNVLNVFGFFGNHFGYFYEHGYSGQIGLSNSWLFDNFIFGGILGWILFIVALVFGVKSVIKFINNDSEHKMEKSLLVAFLLAFGFYTIFCYESQPYVNYTNFTPYYMSGPFLICLFLLGYTFKTPELEVEQVKELENDNAEITIGEESI